MGVSLHIRLTLTGIDFPRNHPGQISLDLSLPSVAAGGFVETCIVPHRYPCGPHGKGLCNVTCMPEPLPPQLCLFKVYASDKPSCRAPLHEIRVSTVGVQGVSISAALPNTYAADMLLLIVIPWFALVVSWFRCMYLLQSRRYW